ncbi:MAG: YchF family ATPase [Patescibacteria group bacterium]|nr:YchF family ATPase [Patescibacteria group bacterium]
MKLSIGIVGLPNVGKSSLFRILTRQEVNVANYPFATIDPNIGVVAVPDERLDKLEEMSGSAKKIPAVVEFYDIAGLVKGAHEGQGLGNQFLGHISEVNAICHVLRCFEDGGIIHVEDTVDPLRDLEIINLELIFKDLEKSEKRMEKLESESRTGDKKKQEDWRAVRDVVEALKSGQLANSLPEEVSENSAVKELQLLTSKPQIFLLNGLAGLANEKLLAKIKELRSDYVCVDLNQAQNVNELVAKAYEVLGLVSFFTTGEDETRAWTIEKGSKAPQAAGAIHSDFEKKFIRAETINWQKLLEAGSWVKARQNGWIRSEGKDYTVQDGDVLEIKHG